MIESTPLRSGLLSLAITVSATFANAQCGEQWIATAPVPGFDGRVSRSALWDPDGAGPATPVYALSGAFVGSTANSPFRFFDPASGTWSGTPAALANAALLEVRTLPGQVVTDLYVALDLGNGVTQVATWDGTALLPLGGTMNGPVHALALLANGELTAGGAFTSVGTLAANNIARWNGTSWQTLGAGPGFRVTALTPSWNGGVVAGGTDSQNLVCVGRWSAGVWQPVGAFLYPSVSSPSYRYLYTIAELPNGDVVAGGDIMTLNYGAWGLLKWNGTSWAQFGPATRPYASLVLATGELIVGYQSNSNSVMHWSGSSWTALGGNVDGPVYTLTRLPGGEFLAGGEFQFAGAVPAWIVARWDAAAWHALQPGTNREVSVLALRGNGNLIAGGGFTTIAGVPANKVAEWDGTSWSPFGGGVTGINDFYAWISAVAELPGGDVVVGGSFTTAGSTIARRIARWDGVAWTALGPGLGDPNPVFDSVSACIVDAQGDLVAGGEFASAGSLTVHNIARWDGSAWHALGSGLGPYGVVSCLANLPNGDIVAGGSFTTAGGNAARYVARWDGASWHALGSGPPTITQCIAVLPNGDILAGTWSGVSRWNGTAWSWLPGLNKSVSSLLVLPDGQVLAGSRTLLSGAPDSLARWDGTSWTGEGAVRGNHSGSIYALALLRDGTVEVGGDFTMVDNIDTGFLAHWRPTCPATATVLPTSCTGSLGALTLSALGLPWVGGTFTSVATGFAPNATGAALLGFTSPNLPLLSVTPFAGPGCRQLASAEALALTLPQAGVAVYTLPIPSSPAYVGMTLFHQFLQLEPGAAAQSPLLSSSNGLHLVFGSF